MTVGGVTTLLSVTNTSVLFLRVRPYRSGGMNGPGQFRLKQAGEKKKPRVSRFCLQKIFLPFDYEGNWVQGRAKRKWAASSRPCIPAVKRDASAVPYAVPREKKKKPRDSSPFSTSFASAPYKESQDSDWMELSPSPSARAAALSLSPHSLLPPLLHLLYTPSAAETAIAFPRPFSLTASTAARLVCSFPQLSATDIQHLSQHKLRFAQLIELSILLAQCFVQQQ